MHKLDYLWLCLMEEASELQKECSKMIRFGTTYARIESLKRELRDMQFIIEEIRSEEGIEILTDIRSLSPEEISEKEEKWKKALTDSKRADKLHE